jgi:L-threonylcarbamoyladenylate synthase
LAELQAKQRQVASLRVSTNPQAYAHDLYAQLRSLDQLGADVILVEQPPGSTAWQGINDRLRRAAFDSLGVLKRLLA